MTREDNAAPVRRVPTIVIVAFDDVTASDITGVADVFELANRYFLSRPQDRYRIVVASTDGRPVRTSCGITMVTESLDAIDADAIDTLVVPGGGPPDAPPVPRDVVRWLRAEGRKARRICAVCTGTFLIAEAGLARARRITTHWQAAGILAERYPEAQVDARPIFVRDGQLWSSAGFTAGIDLALAVLEEEHGHEMAMQTARSMVVFLKRPGDQSQFSAALESQVDGDRAFGKLHAWIMQNLARGLTIEVLSAQMNMSPRTFARRYSEQIGRTPSRTVERFRLEAAQRALGESGASLKEIARACGFGDEQNLRRAFVRVLGALPEHYRKAASEA